MVFVTA